MQLTHYNTDFKKRRFPITLVCDNVTNATNIGSIFRIADAFGIEKIVFCGEVIPIGRKMTKTSRATERMVHYEVNSSILNAVTKLIETNHQVISLEITSSSQAIHNFTFSKERPIAIVIGDENFGVSEDILNMSDAIIHIDMYGQNSSMNVVQAANITLYEATKQLLIDV